MRHREQLFNNICSVSVHNSFLSVPSVVILLLLSLFFMPSAHALEVPALQGYVNDYAGMLSPDAKNRLNDELKAFEQSDSTQIVILTIPSLEGEVVEEFGIKVAEAWKIGQKGKDNGILFIVSRQDRKIRIEVGRGLEGNLTDLMAGRIIDLVIKPKFKRGDFDGGLTAGVAALIDASRGEFKADSNHLPQKKQNSSRFLTFLIFLAIALLVLGSISRVLGGLAGAIGLPVLVHLAFMPLSIIAALILAVLGLGAGFLIPLLFSSRGHYTGGGFWPGGGFYGGGGSSSGSSDFGGGFSGGGGDFGGGGASGDW